MRSKMFTGALVCLMGAGVVGCETKAGTGALIGGAGGAAAGGAIGSLSHSRAGEGALIGAAVGAIGGALVGHSMDKTDEHNAQQDRYSEHEYDSRHLNASASGTVVDPFTKADVISMTRRGVRDDVIIDRIERSHTVFHLTAADENNLRDRGVSEPVIRAMHDSAWR